MSAYHKLPLNALPQCTDVCMLTQRLACTGWRRFGGRREGRHRGRHGGRRRGRRRGRYRRGRRNNTSQYRASDAPSIEPVHDEGAALDVAGQGSCRYLCRAACRAVGKRCVRDDRPRIGGDGAREVVAESVVGAGGASVDVNAARVGRTARASAAKRVNVGKRV